MGEIMCFKQNISQTKRSLEVFCVLALFIGVAASVRSDEYTIDKTLDGVLVTTGVGSAVASEFLLQASSPDLGSLDKSSINGFDRSAMFSSSSSLDTLSSVLVIGQALSPVAFGFFLPRDQSLAAAAVYAEAFSFAYLTKNLLKYALPRYRPYVYSGDKENAALMNTDEYDSFPSGHTTVAFAAATFSVYTYNLYFPDSPYFLHFALANYGLASLTALLRVTSGNHFLTDVLAGAAIGTAFGYVIPALHAKQSSSPEEKRISFFLVPGGVMVDIKLY